MNLYGLLFNGSVRNNHCKLLKDASRIIGSVAILIVFMQPLITHAEAEYKEAVPVAEDPKIEKRMLTLTEDLRCLVCQNETIADSRADFSNDMRRVIREQIKAGKTDAEIIDFLVERYGDFVLYNPPMKTTTVLLWFGPLIFFIFSALFLVKYLKGRRVQIEDVDLTEDEQKKVAALLDDDNAAALANKPEKSDHSNNPVDGLNQEQRQGQQVEASKNNNKGNNVCRYFGLLQVLLL